MATTSRRLYGATFKRQPAPNWSRGMQAAMAALYSTDPLASDVAAQIERECAAVPDQPKRQGDLALALPERPSE